MTDLSHWDSAEEFSGYQTAALILGFEPMESEDKQSRIQIVVDRMKKHYNNAVASLQLDVWGTDYKQRKYDDPSELIGLPSAMMAKLSLGIDRYNDEATPLNWLASDEQIQFENQTFERGSIVRWLSAIGLTSKYKFSLQQEAGSTAQHTIAQADKEIGLSDLPPKPKQPKRVATLMAESVSAEEKPDTTAAMVSGLLTKDIAVIFNGINKWNTERWVKNLSSSKWSHPARISLGAAGGASSVWNPQTLAQLIHGREKDAKLKVKVMNALNSRFTVNPVLRPWRDAFNEYFATYCTTD